MRAKFGLLHEASCCKKINSSWLNFCFCRRCNASSLFIVVAQIPHRKLQITRCRQAMLFTLMRSRKKTLCLVIAIIFAYAHFITCLEVHFGNFQLVHTEVEPECYCHYKNYSAQSLIACGGLCNRGSDNR